ITTGRLFAQSAKRPFKPADILNEKTLSDPHVSPDNKWGVYCLSETDTAKDKTISHLWMQETNGSQTIQLTYDDEDASSPRWSPDGKYISFLSSRDSKKGAQLWLLNQLGGEGKKLTDIKGEIGAYAWSPDAKKIALVIRDPENNGKEEPKTPLPIRIDRYHFKEDMEGYLQHLRSHLYLYDVGAKKLDTLTKGNTDEDAPVWSPDGSKIAFVSNRSADPERNDNNDIF